MQNNVNYFTLDVYKRSLLAYYCEAQERKEQSAIDNVLNLGNLMKG